MNDIQSQELSELTEVLSLKDSSGWSRIVRDAQAAFDGISSSWFNLQDGSMDLTAARASAISNRYIIDLMSLYEAKLNDLGTELISKEQDTTIQTTAVENHNEEQDDD